LINLRLPLQIEPKDATFGNAFPSLPNRAALRAVDLLGFSAVGDGGPSLAAQTLCASTRADDAVLVREDRDLYSVAKS
jgi:hypothetical protein